MPETATLPRSGLITTDNVPVPLTGVAIDAEISNLCGRVTITQRFVNLEEKPIEAVYLFPLDEGAAVCAFEAVIDGTLVVGEVKEREEAFRMYDDAMEQGHGAMLLDEERPDVFQASVGNLLPGKEVLLKISYVTELSVDGGSLRFAMPTTVSPRYAPAADHAGVGRPDAETLNPPLMWSVPYGLELKVTLSMAGAIERIESPSHAISVGLNGNNATVALSQRETALDRDFVLIVDAPAFEVPQSSIEKDEAGAHAIALALVPKLPDQTSPAEIVFVVDRSGSMQGTSIAEVRNALQLCLRSMIAGCRFNIIGFGSTTDALFAGCRDYTEASLQEASKYVANLEADLGGTELLPAITAALEQPLGSLARRIVVITDGQITNTDAALQLAATHAPRARIFTFGIGAGASPHLVKGLARAGGGTAEFIYPGERIEPKVVRQFGRLLSPALTNVCVDWGGLEVTAAPASPPPIFSNGRLILYGFLRSVPAPWQPTTVRLTADAASGPVSFELRLDPSRVAAGRTVATLAARARIRELEESTEWTATRGSRQHGRKQQSVTSEIVELSIRYGLISREASYVAIERRDAPVAGDVELRRVPIALTTGWGGRRRNVADLRQTGSFVSLSALSDAQLFSRASLEVTGRADGAAAHRRSMEDVSFMRASPTSSSLRRGPVERGAGRSAASRPGFVALVRLQRADGSWELDDRFAAMIGSDLVDLEAALGTDASVADARRAWATALAIMWLHLNASETRGEWRLVEAKAREWLGAVTPAGPDGLNWLEAAERFLSRG